MRGVLRRFKFVRRGWVLPGLAFATVALLAACGAITNGNQDTPASDIFDKVRGMDLLPRYPQQSETTDTRPGNGPRSASYYGSGAVTAPAPPQFTGAQQTPGGDGFDLNFENAPVSTVAKVILGDILGVGYIIDPRVQGTVTLASGRPVPKADILYVLESALRMSNVALVREARGYRLTPLPDATGGGPVDTRPEAGYGLTVVPLQHVSVQTVVKLLDSFATKPGAVRADPGRNLLVIQGTGSERRSALDTILSFDADWMRGQSVGIFPVRNGTPEPIITELERIMDAGEGGLSQGLVRFQPVARLNSILVVSRKPELLKTASTWINRLDSSDATNTGVRVYRVRYGDAKQIAALLNDIFTGRGGGSGLESPTNQLAPGGGMTTTSSGPPGGAGQSAGTFGSRPPTQSVGGAPPVGGAAPPGGGNVSAGSLFGGSPPGGGGGGAGGPGILAGVRITPDVVNNALLIYANQENYRIIESTLRQIDRPQLQVAIDATIAEITLNDSLAYGVQYFLKSSDIGAGQNKGSLIFNPVNANPTLGRVLPAFNFLLGTEAQPRVVLDALHGVTDVKVLSTPSVVVINNQVATLQVGDQIPITTQSATAVTAAGAPIVSSIDYRNTGVILRVVPRINVNGNVLLDIEQEISNVADNANAQTLTPTVSERKIKSSISVASGQTVLLGGLISQTQNKTRSGIPILDQIPNIGDAFARNNGTVVRTELIIFIRPQIIRDSVDAYRIAEELRGKMRGKLNASDQPATPQLFRPKPPTAQ
jgi:general secretion pathway protein D